MQIGDKFNSTYVPETVIEITRILPTVVEAKVITPLDIAGRLIADDIKHFPQYWRKAA
jgi:hypothetical protein